MERGDVGGRSWEQWRKKGGVGGTGKKNWSGRKIKTKEVEGFQTF